MRRHELSDAARALVAPFVPDRPPRRGGPWRDRRALVNAVLWRLGSGVAWRDLPERSGPRQTADHRFNAVRRSGLLDRIRSALQLRLNAAGLVAHTLCGIDGTNVRAARPAAGAAKKTRNPGGPDDRALGRSRGGFGTKVHLVRDGNGLPLAAEVTPARRQESTQFGRVPDKIRVPNRRGRPRCRPVRPAGDNGYSDPRIRRWLRRHGLKDVIPRRKHQRPHDRRHRFDKVAHKRRAVAEPCVGWLNENRAAGTRHDKRAVNDLTGVKLAMMLRYLRLLTR